MLQTVIDTAEFRRVLDQINRGARVISISGLVAGPARALVLAALQHQTGKHFALVVPAQRDLENWERDIGFWYCALRGTTECGDAVTVLPASETDPYAGGSPHAETLERRALALWRLARRQISGTGVPPAIHAQDARATDFLLLTSRALARRTVAPSDIMKAGAVLRRDEDASPEELADKLIASGYVREDPVGAIGEFSMRGGILDVWPPGHDAPVRIEFFGDTVDSIREFDPETQLSTTQLPQVEIAPMRELIARPSDFREWAAQARARWHDPRFARSMRDRTDFAEEGEDFPGWEWLLSIVRERNASIFDYLNDAILVIDEPVAVENFLVDAFHTLEERYAENDAADDLGLRPDELYLSAEELRSEIDRMQRIEVRALGRTATKIDQEIALDAETPKISVGKERAKRRPLFLFPATHEPRLEAGLVPPGRTSAASKQDEGSAEIAWQAQSVMRYHGRLPDLARDVIDRQKSGATTLFVMPSSGVAERVTEILRDYEVNARLTSFADTSEFASPDAIVTSGKLSGGFELPTARLVVHIEGDLFDEAAEPALERRATAIKREKKRRARAAAFLSDFRDLKVDDYVVHIDHGIARFGGLVTLDLGPTEAAAARDVAKPRSEFMLLYYADEAKLYVPVERLDLVQRYSSAEGNQPTLDKLGGLGWHKTKAKAKRAMRDMADELLRLYAERKLVHGHAFPQDTPWQHEFEQGFEYTLTADQETAIEDVKTDMQTPTPMDRLLCGDVGYGKTEVAMRAAFKTVMDGKQAAILTPTTVLAYQHFDTFRQRFAPFPVKVELLSRFRSTKEQKDVVKRVEAGEVDVVIGTHRMLSKAVSFKDLGLVVVDEEQRFGVAHKERLKQLKKRVDVLTLSATPIPRTLNMSLSGLRDMSLIETPPRDRLAIQTQVVQSSDAVIKSAIDLELARGGQVFFIHNRVESIETIAALVQRLVPNCRIAVAHGQMNEKEMEAIMLDFIAYKFDVLVATTIIENGIDIPRANTIIINRADNYGLSQLYQLRGRVGRSNRRAYAYLLIPAEQELTPIARRRLSAIREFSDLGAGFRIAALDLELRGAGNMLGGEQSGHMDALGFDLYTQMLERTVAELRGEQVEDEPTVSINLGVDLGIPEGYISDMGQRLRTYKRVSSARDEDALAAIRAETEDRYGRVPVPVEGLFDYARLRQAAELVGVVSIDRTREGIAIKLAEKARVAPEKLMELIHAREGTNFAPSGVLRLELNEEEKDQILAVARRVLLQVRADS